MFPQVLLLGIFLSFGSAFHHSFRSQSNLSPHARFAQRSLIDDTLPACYYNLFLANYDGNGFAGASVSVFLDGVPAEGFSNGVTLPSYVTESGWRVSVVHGQNLVLQYRPSLEAVGNETNHEFWVTDTQGNRLPMQASTNQTYLLGSTSCTCVFQREACGVSMRNEWRSLTFCDRLLYMQALQIFRNTTDEQGRNKYDRFVQQHNNVSKTVAQHSLFFPWHRAFINLFETNLRLLGGKFSCVSLPYWDWSLDFGFENSSSVVADFGSFAHGCIQAPFDWWTDPCGKTCVTRRMFDDPNPESPQFPSIASIDLAITGSSDYKYIFRYLVRTAHKVVHSFIGGSMTSLRSPADPLFWLHHANIDRIYAAWQDCWDYDKTGTEGEQYVDQTQTSLQGLDSLVPPLLENLPPPTVRSQIFIHDLNYRYPPIRRSMVQLNKNHTMRVPAQCKWDWFSQDQQSQQGLKFRVEVHNDEQRNRIHLSRQARQNELVHSGDYYSALIQQLREECALNGGFTANDYSLLFQRQADDDIILGPGKMFKNACRLLAAGDLPTMFYH